MFAASLLYGIAKLAGSAAAIAIILTAFGLMVGVLKPADALRRVGVIVGIVILLMVLPAIIASTWSDMSVWQKMGLAGIVLGIVALAGPRRRKERSSKRG
jgi:hypothetical protein